MDTQENIRDAVRAGARRLWRFAGCEFDEGAWELRSGGVVVPLESKPLEILLELLRHAGEVVTKDELLDAVWPGLTVVEGSLATAVSKLRKALGDDAQSVIVTVPRLGYRLVAAVEVSAAAAPAPDLPQFSPGDAVPRRSQWILLRTLSQTSAVWLAEHVKTHERRVFKFSGDAVGLGHLKREATLSRLLHMGLGERPDFVRVLEWNFDEPPFFLESEYGGEPLDVWAESQGGLQAIPRAARLSLFADIVRAVAAAHEVGVLHRDLKPSNVLIAAKAPSTFQVKVADFGSGRVLEPERLAALHITNLAITQASDATRDSLSGTPLYLAPEVLAGHVPTVSADIYALGILLYQIVAGDFRKPLVAGWEGDIDDPLLQEDIAAAASGDPARRLTSALALADRLGALEHRRVERDRVLEAEARARVAERKLEQTRARRPWVVAAAAALILGIAASLFLYIRAVHDRNVAERQTRIANSVNQFLSVDFLSRSSPFKSGKADESLVGAVKQAAPDIDRRFHNEPRIAARLHQDIARALDKRSDWPGARAQYARAAELYQQAEGPEAADTINVRLMRATMEARSYEGGSLEAAKKILAEQEARIAKQKAVREDTPVWLASAKGMIALIANDLNAAKRYFRAAYEKSQNVPSFDPASRLTLKQRMGFVLIRTGEGGAAEKIFEQLAGEYRAVEGAASPNVLLAKLNYLQALMMQGKHEDVVREGYKLYPQFVAAIGPNHEFTLQLLATRAQSEGSLGLWDDAIRDDLQLYNLAVTKQGPKSFFAIAALADASTSQCRAKRYMTGWKTAERAFQLSKSAFGDNAALTQGTALSLANCLIGLNKLDEASYLLNGIDAKLVAQLAGDPDWGADVELAQAQIALARKDYAQARILLSTTAPAYARARAEPYQKALHAKLEDQVDLLLAGNR